jgi:quercetin dioxygenase-like cupin family protein
MILNRWQAPSLPTPEQLKMIFSNEGLDPYLEEYRAGEKIENHKHPFDEIRMVIEGELLMDVSGNQLALRPGDRIEIPSNTIHSTEARGSESCICLCAKRVI